MNDQRSDQPFDPVAIGLQTLRARLWRREPQHDEPRDPQPTVRQPA